MLRERDHSATGATREDGGSNSA